ncbi:MAG: hypothetical protein E7241_11130 [Lachnospiraceae bacterium]|nr:hypothetical protein [Lachnospiraceae bacterium]
MSGQTMSFSDKRKLMEDFIEKSKPYEKHENLHFDLRGYARYLEENSISGKDVPKEVVERFKR